MVSTPVRVACEAAKLAAARLNAAVSDANVSVDADASTAEKSHLQLQIEVTGM